MSSKTSETTEYVETTTWREKARALRDRLTGGGDVTPVELAEADQLAAAEAEVETSAKTRHERKREDRERAAAEKRADELAAGIDPAVRDAVDRDVRAAWDRYVATIDAARETYAAHSALVVELAREVTAAGAPVVTAMDQANRNTRVSGDRVTASHGGKPVVSWRGNEFKHPEVWGDKLPHSADERTLRRLAQLRGRVM